jgi:hypothetical protein
MTLSTCAFSQEKISNISIEDFITSTIDVMEMTIGRDTIVAMKKPHAKYIAGIRVKYDYQLAASKQKDTLFDAAMIKLQRYAASESELQIQLNIKDAINDSQTVIARGYVKERNGFRDLYKRQKRITIFVTIGAVVSTVLVITIMK